MAHRTLWCLVYATELHAAVLLAPLRGAAEVLPQAEPTLQVAVETSAVDAAPASATEMVAPTPSTARSHAARAPRARPAAMATPPPAAAASAIALPDRGALLPVGTAPAYPGGPTASDGDSTAYGGWGGTGGGLGWPQDLSSPARLGGTKIWGNCRADGVLDLTVVRLRALVRADGSAEQVESADPPGIAAAIVLRGAMPCALRERYVPARDRLGRPVKQWSLPFRTEVVGLLRSVGN